MSEDGFEFELDISEEYFISIDTLFQLDDEKWVLMGYPVVYFLQDKNRKEAYVGESTNIRSRLKDHLKHEKRKQLNRVSIIGSQQFNKSAALEMEFLLIQYLFAERVYHLHNGNAGYTRHNYYQRQYYQPGFVQLWDKMLSKGLVTRLLPDIENDTIFKLSPYKALNGDQYHSVIEMLDYLNTKDSGSIIVNGLAGTGKTVVAIYLIKLLVSPLSALKAEPESADAVRELQALKEVKERFPKLRIAMVVPTASLRETIQKVFVETPGLRKNMVITASQTFTKEKYDILLVDEAHRLRQKKNLTQAEYAAFNRNNRKLGLGDEGTELDWILANSRHQIFFYDSNQTVSPSDIPAKHFDRVLKRHDTMRLSLRSQMRVIGGPDYLTFVDLLMHEKPEELRLDKIDKNYEFFYFDSFRDMLDQLQQRENIYELCRCIAGYSWKWESRHDPSVPDIEIEGVSLYWNREPLDWINSDGAKGKIREVGSIHTTQGYDLNYAGVIFGKEITYNTETNQIEIDREHYHDVTGKKGIKDPEELKQFIVNIYKAMLSRGMRGTFVYACDPGMKAYLKATIPTYKVDLPFKVLTSKTVKPYVNAVPVVDLKAAASGFGSQQHPEQFSWVELPNNIKPRKGYFVCQVVGESMNQKIPNGSWCLFTADEGGTREGKTVLVQHSSIQDADFGSGFTIKEYHSEKIYDEDGWKHQRIVLKPKSDREFPDIVLEEDALTELKVVGVFHSVL